MKAVSGYLRRLGESTVDLKNDHETYTIIEINDQVLTNVRVSRKLANFVGDGVGDETILYIHNSDIVACTVKGKTFYDSGFKTMSGSLVACVCGIAAAFAGFLLTAVLLNLIVKNPSGFTVLMPFVAFPVSAVLGYLWAIQKFAKPSELALWESQGATAV